MPSWTFQQEKLIILFDPKKNRVEEDSQYVTYRFDPNIVSFQHHKKQHRKQTVSRSSIHSDVISYKELLKFMSNKEFPKAYGAYAFFIAVRKGPDDFMLFEAEPVWIIDEAAH